MPRTSRIGNHAGFTLLELVLAITLGGIVLTAVYTTFSVAIDTQRRVTRVARQTQAWRFFSERLRADIKNILAKQQSFKGDNKSIAIQLTNSNTVRYMLKKSAGNGQIRRIVSLDDKVMSNSVVFEGATQLRFRYLGDSSWQNKPVEGIPNAVECTVIENNRKHRLVVSLEIDDAEN